MGYFRGKESIPTRWGATRLEVNLRYDADLEKFLYAKIVKTLHPNQLDQFVALWRQQHGDLDERPAFRRRPRNSKEPRLGLNLVEREDLS